MGNEYIITKQVNNVIKVYDTQSNSFRDINFNMKQNGFVLFYRTALSIIEYYYNICGFFYLDRVRRKIHLIDLNDSLIAIPECSFIEMIDVCKSSLVEYNISERVDYNPSLGFISLYLQKNIDDISDFFTKLCYSIMKNTKLLNSFVTINDSIIYPISVEELYIFTKNVYKLTHFDYITPDYDTSFKYTIDSLINGYHINFSKNDIEKYVYNISLLAYEKVAKNNG